jgi:hypothetical protein
VKGYQQDEAEAADSAAQSGGSQKPATSPRYDEPELVKMEDQTGEEFEVDILKAHEIVEEIQNVPISLPDVEDGQSVAREAQQDQEMRRSHASNDSNERKKVTTPKLDKGKSVVRDNGRPRVVVADWWDFTKSDRNISKNYKRKKKIIRLQDQARGVLPAVRIPGIFNRRDTDGVQITELLELKQKQANISEARSARHSAEEAALQAEETTKQGYTIMLVYAHRELFSPRKLTSQPVYYRYHSLRKLRFSSQISILTTEVAAIIHAGKPFCSRCTRSKFRLD